MSPCRQRLTVRGCFSLSASKQAVFRSRGMMKSSVTSNSSIVRRKGRAGSSGEKTVEASSE